MNEVIDQKSSGHRESSSKPPMSQDCRSQDHRDTYKSSPRSVSTLSERWDLIRKVFERCRQRGLQAPTLDQFDQMHAGSIVPPYNDFDIQMASSLVEKHASALIALAAGMSTTKLLQMKVEAAEGGANVSVTGFVPLPKAPVPTPEEFEERRLASLDLLKQALPGLIPQLVHELVQRDIESQWVPRPRQDHVAQ